MNRIRTAAVGMAVGTLALVACGGGGPARGDRGQTAEEWVACSTTMVVGDVTSVSRGRAGRVSVTVDVAEWLKPAQGQRRVTLDVVDPARTDAQRELRSGRRLLIAVPERDSLEPGVFQGDALRLERDRIRKALGAVGDVKRPSPWRSSGAALS
ncbi:hypothetical protein [Streptomyces sp. NPDC046727]|uniref:hypothetical protein n=1 Tax=Streptomyces sp. NPDC046727 TaxID=3155373 RepID=UPI0033E998ED